MGASESRTLLDRIGRERTASAREAIMSLFDEFDRDRSGKIEGYEIGSLVEVISLYIYNFIATRDKPGEPRSPLPCLCSSPNREALTPPAKRPPELYKIRSWVLLTLDANRNGVLTRDELLDNLPRLMGEFKVSVPKV